MTYNFSNFKEEIKKIDDWLHKEYLGMHTGRAIPSIIDSVFVESYGSMAPIKNVASINIEDARTLRIAPWDKNQIKDIERAIQIADLGLSVVSDSDGLRIIFPNLTTENREKLVKLLKERLEDSRISIRKIREEALNDMRSMQKSGEMTEDELFRSQEELQKFVDEANNNVEVIFSKKENDVMTL